MADPVTTAQTVAAAAGTDPVVLLERLGAGAFGVIIGWFVYYINRYRKGDVQFSDITTVIGIIGGAGILAIFKQGTDLFGAYGIGLFIGFFAYFIILAGLVANSKNFDADFFLDGRRKRPTGDFYIPGTEEPGGGQHPYFRAPQTVVVPPDAIKVVLTTAETAPIYDTTSATDITAICKQEWTAAKADCNQFVRAVANRVGVSLSGNADQILSDITKGQWIDHGVDGVAASVAAQAGHLVIGGLTSTELSDQHGHVVVVVPPTGPLGKGKYPYAYWGSLNPAIRENGGKGLTVNYSFAEGIRDKVHYASIAI